ncbi:uncharacterized protein LOC132193966 [Neocloeon triangulifer]|uniref:uncharacterized protein LOC132193966 n=1 Tax=Neocloeon triangulifer TaxID=2078957 RepID=UPI00286EE7F6|nr:uncharacterized protein LOC132193966 [Neocloeon triangulifer]
MRSFVFWTSFLTAALLISITEAQIRRDDGNPWNMKISPDDLQTLLDSARSQMKGKGKMDRIEIAKELLKKYSVDEVQGFPDPPTEEDEQYRFEDEEYRDEL